MFTLQQGTKAYFYPAYLYEKLPRFFRTFPLRPRLYFGAWPISVFKA